MKSLVLKNSIYCIEKDQATADYFRKLQRGLIGIIVALTAACLLGCADLSHCRCNTENAAEVRNHRLEHFLSVDSWADFFHRYQLVSAAEIFAIQNEQGFLGNTYYINSDSSYHYFRHEYCAGSLLNIQAVKLKVRKFELSLSANVVRETKRADSKQHVEVGFKQCLNLSRWEAVTLDEMPRSHFSIERLGNHRIKILMEQERETIPLDKR